MRYRNMGAVFLLKIEKKSIVFCRIGAIREVQADEDCKMVKKEGILINLSPINGYVGVVFFRCDLSSSLSFFS